MLANGKPEARDRAAIMDRLAREYLELSCEMQRQCSATKKGTPRGGNIARKAYAKHKEHCDYLLRENPGTKLGAVCVRWK